MAGEVITFPGSGAPVGTAAADQGVAPADRSGMETMLLDWLERVRAGAVASLALAAEMAAGPPAYDIDEERLPSGDLIHAVDRLHHRLHRLADAADEASDDEGDIA